MNVVSFLLMLCSTFSVFVSLNSIVIPLYRQRTPRNGLQYLPPHYKLKIQRAFKPNPKPKPKNDTIALYRYLDSEFYGVVGIGNPVRYFNMIFDTAWRDTWVVSSFCPPQQIGCWFHNKYDGSKSSTHIKNGTEFTVREGSNNISGIISIDELHVSHQNIPKYAFAEIDVLPWPYMLHKADGVIGMSLSRESKTSPPFLQFLINNGLIEKPIFSVYINRDRQSNHGGHIFIGGIEEKHKNKNESFTRLPVVGNFDYWKFAIDSIAINLTTSTLPINKGCEAIIDTGTNEIKGPPSQIKQINRVLKAKPAVYGQYIVDCNTVNKLPDFLFILRGKPFIIKNSHYILKVSYSGIEMCVSAFSDQTTLNETWILGSSFLSEVYTSYDLAKKIISFATARSV